MLTVGIGAAAQPVADTLLDLGPQHPTSHGVVLLDLEIDGGVIARADPRLGFVHRGAEKLFEVRDVRQAMALANRHDWHSAFGSEMGLAMVAEEMLGIEVPQRANWTRVLLAELNRVHAHLAFLGTFPVTPPDPGEPRVRMFDAAQQVIAAMEQVTGHRMHHTFNRIGGVAHPVPDGWVATARAAVAAVRAGLPTLRGEVLESTAAGRFSGVGVLRSAEVHGYGVTGPSARASGVDVDLRRDAPYAAYGEVFAPGGVGRVVTRSAGDVPARLAVRLDEVEVSCAIVEAAADRLEELGSGGVNVPLPKVVRLPEGDHHVATENPLGANGWYLVSRGAKTPWRLRVRTASFNNASVLPALLPGVAVADLAAVIASLGLVVGDIDK